MWVSRFFALALIVFAANPAAADWNKSALATAPSYFPARTAAMVVGVGAPAQRPAAALMAALQDSHAFELVMDARALGPIDKLPDGLIVRRAFALPIKHVAIVRIVAGKAVVTVYAEKGKTVSTFALPANAPLAANPDPDGLIPDDTTGPRPDRDLTYRRTPTGVQFFARGQPVADRAELFDELGMPAKAHAYRGHRRWAVGGAVMVAAGTLGLVSFGAWGIESGQTTPLLLGGASLAVLVFGAAMWHAHPDPGYVTDDEATSEIDAHKHRSLQVTPAVVHDGAGVFVTGTF